MPGGGGGWPYHARVQDLQLDLHEAIVPNEPFTRV